MSSIDHLHSEAKQMLIKEHNEMLSKQFLLSTMRQQHPNHGDITNIPRRLMKKTLVSEYSAIIRPITTGGLIDDHKEGIKTIHTVKETISSQADSKVLGEPAPRVQASERILPRRTRTILSQLRLGYSTHLNYIMYITINLCTWGSIF